MKTTCLWYIRWQQIGNYVGKENIKKFRTVISIITMVIAGIVGFFIGATMNEAMSGSILFSLIDGIACIVYTIDNCGDFIRNNYIDD